MAGINLSLGLNTTGSGGGSSILGPVTALVQPVVTAGSGGVAVGVTTPVTSPVTATIGLSDLTGATGTSEAATGQGALTTTLTLPGDLSATAAIGSGSGGSPTFGALGGVGVVVTTPVLGGVVTVGGSGSTGDGTTNSGAGGVGIGVTTPVLGGTVTIGGSGSGGDGTSGSGGAVGMGVTTPVLGGTVTIGGSGSDGTTGTGGGVTIGVGAPVTTGGGSGGGVTVVVGGGGGSTSPTGGGVTGGSGGGASAAPTTPDAQSAYVNIFRLGSTAEIPSDAQLQLNQLQQQVNTGTITATQAVLKVADMALGATSVAVTSYQFFTGLTPSAEGLSYLVHSAANATDLSDSYYTVFNTENRYINFASNLGLHSDYSAGFAQVYGSMTFQQAVSTAYERIVGSAEATQAGINPQAAIADIMSRQGYFQAVAHERFGNDNQDLSTKLAAVAYIMEEAVKADVGRYGHAEQNFLFDLADGKAQFHVDLVGTYGALAQPTNTTF